MLSLRAVAEELARDGYRTKRRVYRDGRIVGGIPFTVGPLAYLLQNRIYLGEVVHGGRHIPVSTKSSLTQIFGTSCSRSWHRVVPACSPGNAARVVRR
ncbi:recombinase family protein [Sphingosinicella microcystinivorans]|uniref:recombinase family protein n=1 Tax=Sphingosinicella microcystinivorans TaxID=335406 RepID=UPI003B67BCDA